MISLDTWLNSANACLHPWIDIEAKFSTEFWHILSVRVFSLNVLKMLNTIF